MAASEPKAQNLSYAIKLIFCLFNAVFELIRTNWDFQAVFN